MEKIDRRDFQAIVLDVMNQVGTPTAGFSSECILNLPDACFDGAEIEPRAAEEAHHTSPHALDGHPRRSDSAGHLANHVREPHTMRRGEATLAQPFGIYRR